MQQNVTMLTALKKYAVFEGRAQRKEYWLYVLLTILLGIGASIIDRVINHGATTSSGPISTIVSLATLIPSIAAGVRRMHDTDHSGWWLLLPIVNLVFACTDGTRGTNRFGGDPKGLGSDDLSQIFS